MRIRKILDLSFFYNIFQNIVGAKKFRKILVENYIKPFSGCQILDIGCGTAEILNQLPKDIKYTGYDFNENYIIYAKEKYNERGQFILQNASEPFREENKYDVVMAIGLLHHLEDQLVTNVLNIAFKALKVGGRFVSVDPCFESDLPMITRAIISKDRGAFYRNKEQYIKLLEVQFSKVIPTISCKLLNIPYCHIIIEAYK